MTLIGHNSSVRSPQLLTVSCQCSPTIRQRALHAARMLQVSKSKPLLAALTLRLNEAHEPVVQAALLLAEDLHQVITVHTLMLDFAQCSGSEACFLARSSDAQPATS